MQRATSETIGRTIVVAFFALFLSSCAVLETARLKFNQDASGQLTFQVRVLKKGLRGESIPKSLIEAINACGFQGRQTNRPDEIFVDSISNFENSTVMATNLDCLPSDWSRREVALTSDKGLFYTNYITTVWLEQPAAARRGDSAMLAYLNDSDAGDDDMNDLTSVKPLFPLRLSIDVPGRVIGIDNLSAIPGSKASTAYAQNHASIELNWDENDKTRDARILPVIEAINAQENIEIPVDRYKFVIHSHEARFEIGTIVTLVGALFGSGILVQLIAWLRNRRATAGPTRRRTKEDS